MAVAATATATATFSNSFTRNSLHHSTKTYNQYSSISLPQKLVTFSLAASSRQPIMIIAPASRRHLRPPPPLSIGGGNGISGIGGGGGGNGGGGGRDENEEDEDEDRKRNKVEALAALAEAGRAVESLPADVAAAAVAGRLPGEIVKRYLEMEKSAVFRWLLGFGGFKERLLADDLFLTKVAIECGIGIFTKTAAEFERRRENFTKELDFVCADVVMALVADFMLVWLPAPTVSLRPPIPLSAGRISKFFYGCPENAFQVAFAGTSFSPLQRLGAIVRNGAKLFLVGTSASIIGTGVTNSLIKLRKLVDKSFAGGEEDLPIVSTSIAYGVYMSISSNLRYQVLAGVIEQRILEPLLHRQKVALGALCFVVRTSNTFLGSMMWVDFVRLVGIQKPRE